MGVTVSRLFRIEDDADAGVAWTYVTPLREAGNNEEWELTYGQLQALYETLGRHLHG